VLHDIVYTVKIKLLSNNPAHFIKL